MFAPCEYLGHKFVDGGILDNIPAQEVKKLGVDKVLAIKLSTAVNYEPKNIYEVAFKSIDILCDKVAEESIKQSNMIIDLDLTIFKIFINFIAIFIPFDIIKCVLATIIVKRVENSTIK